MTTVVEKVEKKRRGRKPKQVVMEPGVIDQTPIDTCECVSNEDFQVLSKEAEDKMNMKNTGTMCDDTLGVVEATDFYVQVKPNVIELATGMEFEHNENGYYESNTYEYNESVKDGSESYVTYTGRKTYSDNIVEAGLRNGTFAYVGDDTNDEVCPSEKCTTVNACDDCTDEMEQFIQGLQDSNRVLMEENDDMRWLFNKLLNKVRDIRKRYTKAYWETRQRNEQGRPTTYDIVLEERQREGMAIAMNILDTFRN